MTLVGQTERLEEGNHRGAENMRTESRNVVEEMS